MKACFIGAVDFSKSLLAHLIGHDGIDVVGVVTRRESNFNADHYDLSPLALNHGIPVHYPDNTNPEKLLAWLADLQPDIIFCLGWSYLLPDQILNLPEHGVIGYHPALLPRNRGRHPIIWALVLGLSETGSTFFQMDTGADSGDIISQRRVPIHPDDDAARLYKRLNETAEEQLAEITLALTRGTLRRHPQDHSKATYWRKRTAEDGCIDWRMTSTAIVNLVRGLNRPYVGAHCTFLDKDVKIWKAVAVPCPEHDIEPGKILDNSKEGILIKSGDGAVRVIEHEFGDISDEYEYVK